MKYIKLGIISIVMLFLLMTAISALLPSHVRISRAINIAASPARINAVLSNCNTWAEWNTYVKAIPSKTVSVNSIRSEPVTINVVPSPAAEIRTVWKQKSGKTYPGVFSLTGRGNYTIVQWYFDFRFRWYPWEKFSSMVYDKQLGPVMEQSLANLQQLLEKKDGMPSK